MNRLGGLCKLGLLGRHKDSIKGSARIALAPRGGRPDILRVQISESSLGKHFGRSVFGGKEIAVAEDDDVIVLEVLFQRG